MKTVDIQVLSWQRRRQLRMTQQALRSAGQRKQTRISRRTDKTRDKRKRIVPPQELRFHGMRENRRAFTSFVHAAETELARGHFVKFDLAVIKVLYPCGLLLFMAYVHSWLNQYPGKLSASMPKDTIVEQMLQRVGLLAKLNLVSTTPVSHEDVLRWDYFTGTDVNLAAVEPFMDRVRVLASVESQSYLMDCLNEAVTNVRHHAYQNTVIGGPTPWWVFATISKDMVTVAVHDRGSSIPGTLMGKPGVREQVMNWIVGRKHRDARMLEAAVNGRSRTKLAYRGKGLPEMLEFTSRTPGSSLGIYSRQGAFFHHTVSGAMQSFGLNVDMQGTLILWSLALTGEPS